MTEKEKLKMLKHLTGETDESVLSAYLFLAKEAVLDRAYPFGEYYDVPKKYEAVQIEIAEYLLNKRGAEGEKSHSENGVTRTYESADIPRSLLRRITPMAGVM